ncbi:MAG: hypothetical protein K6E19_06655 [Lachnospiraceae bacterium]|nr:hypothetical protein [Lachnospiraceae bacterium]
MSEYWIGLKTPFFELKNEKETFFGGRQQWFDSKRLRGYACGVIACANILTHCRLWGSDSFRKIPECEEYLKLSRDLTRFYLPVIPRFGMNGMFMALGINIYFLIHRLPYRAFWGISKKKIDSRIGRMLAANIPVCLAIGPNFPNLFGNHRLTLYRKNGNSYEPSDSTRAHYVSVTAMDGDWYEISTWGYKMYINKKEYFEYIRKHSSSLFSNVLVVKPLHSACGAC